MSVRLYTLYADLRPATEDLASVGPAEIAELREKGARRDRIALAWMQQNGVGTFPKSEREVARLMPMFADYTRRNPALHFLFVDPRGRVRAMHRGAIARYADYETAVREIFAVPDDTRVVTHRTVHFARDPETGLPNAGIPPGPM